MLTDQRAWDVAPYMNSHERPQDPQYTGSVQGTWQDCHATQDSMVGRAVAGNSAGRQRRAEALQAIEKTAGAVSPKMQ
jgi:cytochrome c